MKIFMVSGTYNHCEYMFDSASISFSEICVAETEEQVRLMIERKYNKEHGVGDFDLVTDMTIKPALYWNPEEIFDTK